MMIMMIIDHVAAALMMMVVIMMMGLMMRMMRMMKVNLQDTDKVRKGVSSSPMRLATARRSLFSQSRDQFGRNLIIDAQQSCF